MKNSTLSSGDIMAAQELLRGEYLDVDAGEYEYFDDATRTNYVCDRTDLGKLGRYIREGVDRPYSQWCAATQALTRAQYDANTTTEA